MTCIIYQLFKKNLYFHIHFSKNHSAPNSPTLANVCFYSISLSLPYGLYIAIILVSCALCLCPRPHPSPNHPLPACMLHVSCACSSIFIVAFYVSRDCNRDLFICAFIHTLISIRCLSVWKCYVQCLYNVCSIRSQMYSFTKN